MADIAEVIKKAVEEREKLQERLDKLNLFIEMAQSLNEEPASVKQDFSKNIVTAQSRIESRPMRLRVPSDYIVNAVKRILRRSGRPMTRFELVDELQRMNIEINGVDKAKNLGTILWRSPQFISTDEGYWLADRPSDRDLMKA